MLMSIRLEHFSGDILGFSYVRREAGDGIHKVSRQDDPIYLPMPTG